MRLLLDQNLSPLLPMRCGRRATTCSMYNVGLATASDQKVLACARQGHVLVSADTDFGALLAQEPGTGPSVILLQRSQGRRAAEHAALILGNLDVVADDLDAGCVVVFTEDRSRVRRLPIPPVR